MAITDQVFSRLRRTLSSIFRIGNIQIKDNSETAEIRNADDSAYADLQAGDATFSKITISDSASEPPITLTARSSAPSSPSINDMYIDDGTNTDSGKPNLLRYTGAVWEELGDGFGIDVTDETTTVSPTYQLTFDDEFFSVMDEGGDEASVTIGAGISDNLILMAYPSGNQSEDIRLAYNYAGETIDTADGYAGSTSDSNWGNFGSGHIDWTQSFLTSDGGLFTEFTFTLGTDDGTPTTEATWYIAPSDGSGADIDNALSSDTMTLTINDLNTITIASNKQVVLEPNTNYWIALDSGVLASGDHHRIRRSFTESSYADGDLVFINDKEWYTGREQFGDADEDLLMTFTIDSFDQNDVLAQPFQLAHTATIDLVKLYLKKNGTPSDTLTLRIETDDSDLPSSILANVNATITVSESSLITDYSYITFDFGTEFQLDEGVKYWLVLSTDRTNSSVNYVLWGSSSSIDFVFGSASAFYNSAWNALNQSLSFEIHGTTQSNTINLSTVTMRHIYRGLSTSSYKEVVAIGDFGAYPSLRRRASRSGVIMESGILTGGLVKVAISGEVLVVCAETINAGDQLRPFYDETLEDINGYVGRVIKWDGDDPADETDEDFGVMYAVSGGNVDDTITAVLTEKNNYNDMRVFKLGEARMKNDTYLATVQEAFPDEVFELGETELGITSYLTHRQL